MDKCICGETPKDWTGFVRCSHCGLEAQGKPYIDDHIQSWNKLQLALKNHHALIEIARRCKALICKDCCGGNCTCEQTVTIDNILNQE